MEEMLEEALEEAGEEAAEGPAKISGGLLCIIIFDLIALFGEALKSSVSGLFFFNKLHKTPGEVLFLLTVFGSIEHFIMPIGGLIADITPNKFIVLVFAYLVFFGNNALFTLLTVHYFHRWKWPIIYTTESIGALDSAIIEPTSEAFLMDQFKYPEEIPTLRKFVHAHGICAKVLIILAHFVSPILKTRISCFHDQDCYLISYGLFLVLYAVAQIIFYIGAKYYIIKKPEKEVVVKVAPCIWYGFVHSLRERRSNEKPHWMDYAVPKYSAELVEQAKAFLRVQFMRIGIPFFVAISHNLAMSEFIVRIRTRQLIGSYKMIPDHLNLLEPVIGVLVWIFMAKIGERRIKNTKLARPLRRLFFGLNLDILVAILYGLLAWQVVENLPIAPEENESQLRIFNSADCPCTIEASKFLTDPLELEPGGSFTDKHISVHSYEEYQIKITGSCFANFSGEAYLEGGEAISIYIKYAEGKVDIITYKDMATAPIERSLPRISLVGADPVDKIKVIDTKGIVIDLQPATAHVAGVMRVTRGPRLAEVLPGWYTVYRNDHKVLEFDVDLGGIYNIMMTGDSAIVVVIAEPNSVHFWWLIPIQIVDSFSDYFISIGVKEFDFPETPPGLRGTSSAILQVLSGFGYMFIPMYITSFRMDYEFYYYALLKIVLLALFLFCAMKIRSRHPNRKLI